MALVPASIRNRNPGAQYPGPSSKKFGSTAYETLTSKDGVHKIATFPTHVHGVAALFDLLERSYTGMTVQAAITKWCGGYYVNTYTRVLEDKGGVKASDKLTSELLRDANKAIPLAKAMAFQEAGQDYPLDDAGWSQGHEMAFGLGAIAPAWTPDNDVPTPKPETRNAAWRGWWGRATAWFATLGTGATVTFDTTAKFAADVMGAATSWSPIKNFAVELGANARAVGLGLLATGVVKVVCGWCKET